MSDTGPLQYDPGCEPLSAQNATHLECRHHCNKVVESGKTCKCRANMLGSRDRQQTNCYMPPATGQMPSAGGAAAPRPVAPAPASAVAPRPVAPVAAPASSAVVAHHPVAPVAAALATAAQTVQRRHGMVNEIPRVRACQYCGSKSRTRKVHCKTVWKIGSNSHHCTQQFCSL